MKKLAYGLMAVLLLGVFAYTVPFTVDETQYGVVTTFGRPARQISEPGLYWKWPSPIQSVLRFDKRLQVFDPRPTENFTLDRKNLLVDCYACWRIGNANRFLEKVQTIEGAENSLAMLVASELSAELGKHELSAIISTKEEEVQLSTIMASITERCRTTAAKDYGIEIEDVRIKRVNLPDENKQSVYRRMRAEREQKAKEYRAQGQEKATMIRAETEQRQREVLSTAYKEAQKIKGEGEAAAMRLYAQAYGQAPELYKFRRTLDAYKKVLTGDTTMVLSSESKFLELLTHFDAAALAQEEPGLTAGSGAGEIPAPNEDAVAGEEAFEIPMSEILKKRQAGDLGPESNVSAEDFLETIDELSSEEKGTRRHEKQRHRAQQ